MWWLSSSLLPLVGSLYIQASTALTTTDIFSPLKNGVVCTDAQITTMNTCITDTIALATIFDSALKAAVQSTETTGTEGQDGVVARKLLTKWFGIKFTGSGEQSPDSDSADAWTQIQAVSTDVLMYASIGYLEAPGMDMSSEGLPWLSCEGTNFMSLQWDQQLLKYDPSDVTTPIKGVKVDNQPIYIDDVYTQGDGMGIWFLPEKNYYAPLKSSFYPTTICGTNSEGLNIIAVSFTGNDESTKTLFDKTLDIAAVQPGMVMCPDTSSASVSTLADVKWSDPADKSQISDVIAMASSTLFHEFTHLTTFWGKVTDPNSDKFGDFYLRGSSTVLDYAYATNECLELAAGTLTKDGTSYTSYHSTFNARNYEYFIFAWWYYKQTWTYTDSSGNTQTRKPATFYDGYLVEWDVLPSQS